MESGATVTGIDRALQRKWVPKFNTSARWPLAALVLGLSVWILWSFIQSMLWAAVIAVATWPIYRRFATRKHPRVPAVITPTLFTIVVSLLVLAPMVFAFGALAVQAERWAEQLAAASATGLAAPLWLETVPLIGTRLVEHWQTHLGTPGGLSAWLQHADMPVILGSPTMLGLAQTLGQFVARHLFRIVFAILVLFVLYRGGEALVQEINRLLRNSLDDRAEHYIDLATRSLRAMVTGTLAVGLFDGILIGIISALAGVQHPEVWGAMTGVLAAIPFAGYVVVAGLAVTLMAETSVFAGLAVLALGTVIVFVGDKVVRPLLVGRATQLGFVWVIMGSLGGLAITGLLGVLLGPVVLSLAGAVWNELTQKTPSRTDNPVSRPSQLEIAG